MTVAPRHYRASTRRVVMMTLTRVFAGLIVCVALAALVVLFVEG